MGYIQGADRGQIVFLPNALDDYCNSDVIWRCLLNGDTPTTHPNKGERCRIFRFQKVDDDTWRLLPVATPLNL